MTISPWIQEAYTNKTWLMTRGGESRAKVVCIDKPGNSPVICYDRSGEFWCTGGDGKHSFSNKYDLLPPKRQFDVCVYAIEGGHFFSGPENTYHGYKLLARATIAEGSGI